MKNSKPKVIIIGGGFGGLAAAKKLKNKPVDVILIDKTNHHLFQPLLYQVATAGLSPAYIAFPLRSIFRKSKNVRVILGEVKRIDRKEKKVYLNGENYSYDFLIVAVGAKHHYFGKDEWEKIAPGLKTLQDAINIREKILLAFEKAERINDPEEQQKYLNFIVVGGGPTGVEMAGAIAEIARKTLIEDFKKIDPTKAKVYLVEALDRVLPTYPPKLSQKAKEDLEKLGVRVLLNTKVTDLNNDCVKLNGKEIKAATIIWAAGNKANPLVQQLNCELDKMGRAIVSPYLHLKDDESVFVIGDAAAVYDEKGNTLPGVSPVAITEGRYVAKFILRKLKNKSSKPYKYINKGSLATIGKAKAVADFGWLRFSGFFAWLLWVFVHIFFLIGFKNRFIVMIEWIFAYFTYQKSARLIVGEKKIVDE
ncbi:MAG: NAD(P)/FAD-dependent oxidoreductase [Ignavibacteria bacterium]|jgi:NADH dehydrogenase|nr:NAD(P)/FAD-dependent oxidoreductase [Ignavibacteria bacterium]MDH7527926.1 NAD(P)/FAD-dependent oxidoreductase [Ignavibacteria bacterium]